MGKAFIPCGISADQDHPAQLIWIDNVCFWV